MAEVKPACTEEEFPGYVWKDGTKKDEVLKLVPDEGRSLRGLKTGVGRISSSHGLKVESWDDGTAPYSTTAPQTTHTFTSRGTKTTRVDVIGVGGGTLASAQISITVQ